MRSSQVSYPNPWEDPRLEAVLTCSEAQLRGSVPRLSHVGPICLDPLRGLWIDLKLKGMVWGP